MPVCLQGVLAAMSAITMAAAIVAQEAKPDAIDAAALYKQRCAMCHGASGDVQVERQNFADGRWRHGSTVKAVTAVIRNGVPGTTMAPFKEHFSDAQVTALAHYVRSFDRKLRPTRKK